MKRLSGAVHLARDDDDDGGDGDGEWNGQRQQLHLGDVMDGSIRPGTKNKEHRGVLFFGLCFVFRVRQISVFFQQTQLKMMFTLLLFARAGWLAIKVEENKVIPLLQRWKLRMEYLTIVKRRSLSRCQCQDTYHNGGCSSLP